jgi:hypothetical protein
MLLGELRGSIGASERKFGKLVFKKSRNHLFLVQIKYKKLLLGELRGTAGSSERKF